MADPDQAARNRETARIRPSLLLKGATTRLIDEWQEAPELWDAVRFALDHCEGLGQYILTGSAVPPEVDDENEQARLIRHTGAGRIARFTMRPMSLWESGESTGDVSIGELFSGKDPTGASNRLKLEDLAELICCGGWPGVLDMPKRFARKVVEEYLTAIVESDVTRVDKSLRDPERVRHVLKSLARLQGTQSAASVICADLREYEGISLSDDTVYKYLAALRKIYVTDDMPAWCPALLSKTPIRTSDTRYFTDPSVAAAVLGINPGDLMNDLPTCGIFFETMVVRDLRVYADVIGARVSHYHDKNNLECDAVIHLDNGQAGLIEIKLGGEALIEKGVATLRMLSGKLDTRKTPPPASKMVVVGEGDFAYKRPDGIIVCPVGALRP